eukprot:986459-Lingulodinium_polyedra.AAC.1
MGNVDWEREQDAEKGIEWPATQRTTGRQAEEFWERRLAEYSGSGGAWAVPADVQRRPPARADVP